MAKEQQATLRTREEHVEASPVAQEARELLDGLARALAEEHVRTILALIRVDELDVWILRQAPD